MTGLLKPHTDLCLKLACLALCLAAVVANGLAEESLDAGGEVGSLRCAEHAVETGGGAVQPDTPGDDNASGDLVVGSEPEGGNDFGENAEQGLRGGGEVGPGAVGSGIAPLDGPVAEPEKVGDSGSEKHEGDVVKDGGESHYSLLRGVVMFLSGILLYRVFLWGKL